MNHVAFIIPGLDRIGGAEQQTILLAKGLRARGWRVNVVALSGTGGNAAVELAESDIDFLSLEMRKGLADPRGWMRFHRWLKENSPDVVHAHLPHAVWMARVSRWATPVRVVVDTIHSSSTGTVGRRLGYRLTDWLADQVTAVSHAVAQAHLAARMAASIEVIPNGIDVDRWRPDGAVHKAVRAEVQMEGGFLWIAAGRLEAVKDYPTLLAAMARLADSARLVVAGDGALRQQLLRLSQELGLEQRVRFLGFEPDVRRWMQAADGFVLTSLWEGLPMALLEASACGLPAVATDVPGTHDAILDGRTGWLVPEGNPEALAAAMTRLMQASGDDRNEMGEHARRHVLDCFCLESVLNRWEALYTDLLERNRRPARWARTR